MSTSNTETHEDHTAKIRHVRIPTNVWVEAAKKAQSNGTSISRVIRRLLEGYIEGRFTP